VKEVGGYKFAGSFYPDLICDSKNISCRYLPLFAVQNISEDNWLYNQSAQYGQLGLGPKSPIMQQYIDPIQLVSNFSIVKKFDLNLEINLGGFADILVYKNDS